MSLRHINESIINDGCEIPDNVDMMHLDDYPGQQHDIEIETNQAETSVDILSADAKCNDMDIVTMDIEDTVEMMTAGATPSYQNDASMNVAASRTTKGSVNVQANKDGTSSKKSKKCNTALNESEIPPNFNEIEDEENQGLLLRTLVNFELVTADGKHVSFDDITSVSETSPVILNGYLVEPFPSDINQEILKMASTSRQSKPKSIKDVASVIAPAPPPKKVKKDAVPEFPLPETNDNSKIHEIASLDDPQVVPVAAKLQKDSPKVFDRQTLQVGDEVDGYCPQTKLWYQAKVVAVSSDNNSLKIHFVGWNSKHDEWIDRASERIAGRGTAMEIMFQEAKLASEQIPWYETKALWNKVSKLRGDMPLQKRNQIKVSITGIEDYAIDYTYANPTLWLIANGGNVWYRVAGALCPGGKNGTPSKAYAPIFEPIRKKFNCTAQVAMCLLDFLQTMPKLSIDEVVKEVEARTKGEIDRTYILRHHAFVFEQISKLEQPPEWPKSIKISNCEFLRQLKKQGPQFLEKEAKEANLLKKENVAASHRPIKENSVLNSTQTIDEHQTTSTGPATEENISSIQTTALPDKSVRIKYPIEDSEFWRLQKEKGRNMVPFSLPCESRNPQLRCAPELRGCLLQAWSSIMNIRSLLDIPFISLELFEKILIGREYAGGAEIVVGLEGSNDTRSNHDDEKIYFHWIISEIHVALLTKFLIQKEDETNGEEMEDSPNLNSNYLASKLKICTHVDTKNAPGSENKVDFRTSDLLSQHTVVDLDRQIFDDDSDTTSSTDEDSSNATSVSRCNNVEIHVKKLLRTGSMWMESLRHHIAGEFNTICADLADTIAICAELIRKILRGAEGSELFGSPLSDQSRKQMAKLPFDLHTILSRINEGWYDDSGIQDEVKSLSVGMIVDAFNSATHTWTPARIIKALHSSATLSDEEITRQQGECQRGRWQISYLGFGDDDTSLQNVDEHFLLPFECASKDGEKRILSPDSEEIKILRDCYVSSRHRGHDGIAADVNIVFSNIKRIFGEFSRQHDLACNCATEFSQLFVKYISDPESIREKKSQCLMSPHKGDVLVPPEKRCTLSPVHHVAPTNSTTSLDIQANDTLVPWQQVTDFLGDRDYQSIPFMMKVHLLQWLCERVHETSSVREYLDDLGELLYQHDRELKKALREKEKEIEKEKAGENDMAEPTTKPNDDQGGKNMAKKKRKISEFFSDVTIDVFKESIVTATEESIDHERFPDFKSLCTRITPLGSDRDHRTYWHFPQDNARIFIVDGNGWYSFSDASDIVSIYHWLCEKGIREQKLKKKLGLWLREHLGNPECILPATTSSNSNGPQSSSSGMKASNSEGASSNVVADESSEIKNKKKKQKKGDVTDSAEVTSNVSPQQKQSNDKSVAALSLAHDQRVNIKSDPYFKPSTSLMPTQSLSSLSSLFGSAESNVKEPIANDNVGMSSVHTVPGSAVGLVFTVDIAKYGQLGVGIKELDGKVIATSYKYSTSEKMSKSNGATEQQKSASKEAGIRIGDHILCANDRVINCIADLQEEIRRAWSSTNSSTHSSDQNSADKLKPAQKPEKLTLDLLVIRHADIADVVGLKECSQKDHQVAASLIAQRAEDVANANTLAEYFKYGGGNNTQSPSPPSPRTFPLTEQGLIPSSLIGTVLNLLLMASRPFVARQHSWINSSCHKWILKIHALMRLCLASTNLCSGKERCLIVDGYPSTFQVDESSLEGTYSGYTCFCGLSTSRCKCHSHSFSLLKRLHRTLLHALLDLETEMRHSSDVFNSDWVSHRRRQKWRLACFHSYTFAQLGYCSTVLLQYLNIRSIRLATTAISRESFIEDVAFSCESDNTSTKNNGEIATNFERRLSSSSRDKEAERDVNFELKVPAEGRIMIYYYDGHAASLSEENSLPFSSNKPRLWPIESSASMNPTPSPGDILICKVVNVHFYTSGFARVDLIVPQTLEISKKIKFPQPTLKPPVTSLVHLNKIICRILAIITHCESNRFFQSPISTDEYPDYNDVISEPLSLQEVSGKAWLNCYRNSDDFLGDMALIRDNCATYFGTKNPPLVDQAMRMYIEVEKLWRLFEIETRKGRVGRASEDVALGGLLSHPHSRRHGKEEGTLLLGTNNDTFKGNTFSVNIRLDGSSPLFLVDVELYKHSLESHAMRYDQRVVVNGESNKVHLHEAIIVGHKENPNAISEIVPWQWLHIESRNLLCAGKFANPWDIEEAISYKNPSRDTEKRKRKCIQ